MNLKPEQRIIGQENFYSTVGHTRRDFLRGAVAASAVSGAGLGWMYFGYGRQIGKRLRVGIMGTGDEGNVLIGALNPNYIEVAAISDIRPYNIQRALHGDDTNENTKKVRPGLISKYNLVSEDNAKKQIKVIQGDYPEMLADKSLNLDAVIIALPLHLHAPAAIAAMRAGKHVLTEKLMGHSVHECKEMGRVAKETNKILAVGHQRHYSILYDNAVHTIRQKLIGDIHSIRAQWHREADTWSPALPDEDMAKQIKDLTTERDKEKDPTKSAALTKKIETLNKIYLDKVVDASKYEYEEKTITLGGTQYFRSALEELIRWRLWNRTGGGLMAELGSHQLDAAGIFISGLREDGKKALPLNVSAMGGRYLEKWQRECEDHVYCMFEFPGANYDKDPSSIVGVTYSSINGNGLGGYGEVVMGTQGTLILEREQEVMLFPSGSSDTKVTVKDTKGGPTLDTTASGGGEAATLGKMALSGPPSRGYTEEMEHWAWCIRNPGDKDKPNLPRCHPEVALGDAVIAHVTNLALRDKKRIEFKKEWFQIDRDETPEGTKPDVKRKA